MRKRLLPAVLCSSLVSTVACATSFEGSAKFPGGARGCFQRCLSQEMEMASFVFVGEFSTACACQPRRAEGNAASQSDAVSAAVVAATAGVELERRRMAQAAQAGALGGVMAAGHP
jgi:hypothetical protein